MLSLVFGLYKIAIKHLKNSKTWNRVCKSLFFLESSVTVVLCVLHLTRRTSLRSEIERADMKKGVKQGVKQVWRAKSLLE